MTNCELLNSIIQSLKSSSLELINSKNILLINRLTTEQLEKEQHTQEDILIMGMILHISNILYNNTDRNMLPLEDGVYDLLIELYKKYISDYQVGAEPINFESTELLEKAAYTSAIEFVDKEKIDELIFGEDLYFYRKPTYMDLLKPAIEFNKQLQDKRIVNTKHEYPKLVGTLDKCKFVLNEQARLKGVFDDPKVKILERDFFQRHIDMGIIDTQTPFRIVASLKYDGCSVEGTVQNRIEDARTRGDANEDIAADISDILEGYRFPNSDRIQEKFGMKFEAIMTYDNLIKYNIARGKNYKNCRTAISSIFGASDGYLYRDLITLVPLATSIEDIDRINEIEFINKYYYSGESFRYTVIEGDYYNVLFKIKKFVEEAEYLRNIMPFMYDGVVIEYIDTSIIEKLGRTNSVNKYAMAIKFNPLKKLSIFREYKYTVGQDGTITPMIYYDPVEFYGTVHYKSTGHSYERFKVLNLKPGDVIEVEYTNDVMPYVSKPYNSSNDTNEAEPVPFITNCPSCGSILEVSSSGKSIACKNISCPERNIKRITSLMQKLNLKDFAESTLASIAKKSLKELLETKIEDVLFLGEITAKKFMDRIHQLKTMKMYDYKIVGSLGFTSIAAETWKLILHNYTIFELISMHKDELYDALIKIKGIGPGTVMTINTEMDFFIDDLKTILGMDNIIQYKGVIETGKTIRFTGFRDKELSSYLIGLGHDADDAKSVTRNTDILLVPVEGFTSSKTTKVGENTIIVPVTEFKNNMDRYLK